MNGIHRCRGLECEFVECDDIEGEIWMKVPDTLIQNNHFVSNKGRVKTSLGTISTPKAAPNGYKAVAIGGKTFKHHRLVLIAFGIDPPSPKHTTVDHIDRNPSNNNLENLRWATQAEQNRYSLDSNPNRRPNGPRLSKPVRGRHCESITWTVYNSAQDAAEQLGLRQNGVSQSCKHGWKAGDYIFEYSEPNEPELLPGEIWKVCGENGQEISNVGRYKDHRKLIKTPIPNGSGYCRVKVDGHMKMVHRLVADAFLPSPEPGRTEVNHKYGDKSDNRFFMLEWVNKKENMQHSYDVLGRTGGSEKICKKVRAREGDGAWAVYDSIVAAAEAIGVTKSVIGRACTLNKKRRLAQTST